MKKITINDRIYSRYIFLVTDCSTEEFYKFIYRKYQVKIEGHCRACQHTFIKDEKPNEYYIFIPKFEWRIYQHSDLTHEIIHLVFSIFKEVGIEYNEGSEEAYTYYHEYIYQKVMLYFHNREKHEKIKKKKSTAKKQRGKTKGVKKSK